MSYFISSWRSSHLSSSFIALCSVTFKLRVTEHRDLKSTSHKHFCNRILTIQGIILGHGEFKKSCLNSGRNKSSHIFHQNFVIYKPLSSSTNTLNGSINSVKYAIFLLELQVLILKLLDLYQKFYNIKVRTTEYFKVYIRYIFVKLIL